MSPVHLSAHGKLLLTGEYVVLDGALALAVPTRYGQQLHVEDNSSSPHELHWQSLDKHGKEWFSAKWRLTNEQWHCLETSDEEIVGRLEQVFQAARDQKQATYQQLAGCRLETRLEFPREWGLGTSSTLISLLSRYLQIDPYQLLANSFGGSGYDLACAEANGPILYMRRNGEPVIMEREWFPPYSRQLFFVYLGQKQDSRDGIRHYRKRQPAKRDIDHITHLTFDLLEAQQASEAEQILQAHENVISQAVGLPKVQEERFPEFPGTVKSLGAWGGDFALVVSPWQPKKTRAYFNEKGYPTVLGFDDMVL